MVHKLLPYKLIGNGANPMWPFAIQKREVWDAKIQNTLEFYPIKDKDVNGRALQMLEGKFKILFKIVDIPLRHISNLVMICICLHNMCIVNSNGFDMD
jgi:hypothetical protein